MSVRSINYQLINFLAVNIPEHVNTVNSLSYLTIRKLSVIHFRNYLHRFNHQYLAGVSLRFYLPVVKKTG